jgi:hypothetical protein
MRLEYRREPYLVKDQVHMMARIAQIKWREMAVNNYFKT